MKTISKLSIPLLIAMSGVVLAEADGPDYYRVHGVAENDVLNMRSEGHWRAGKVGEIPPGADCVRNLGCQGGLTMDEYMNLSKREQAAIQKKRPRWCLVEYQGTRGWVSGRYLAEGSCNR
ncbi:MAG TPA: SH3 domain-containing protein [Gammaproteobacteria bacterium]|nr:SH3 domain-containing protein [Gammaproteobacteria bacterium]